jgi:succinate dehydrogenase / fumarate reductase, cytochrome b subunit
MAQPNQRPLSPHLGVYKWGPHMLVSILHRATGDGLAILGASLLVLWLFAAASGPECYATFQYYVWKAAEGDVLGLIANIFGRIVLIGLSWAFFQHMLSGLRHFVMDMGAGYELKANRTWSIVTIIVSISLTVLLWAWLLVGRTL